MFYEEGMHSTCLLDLKDSHNVLWWETLTVNITFFVYKKTPQGAFNGSALLYVITYMFSI